MLAALALKALVPGGYMVAVSAKVVTVQLCDDTGNGHLTTQLAIPLKPGSSQGVPDHGKAACPYSSFTHASLAGADPLLLALALAFILALGFLPPTSRPVAPAAYLRPPLRGPPALA